MKSKKILKPYASLRERILEEQDYCWAWHCNIAMPIYDADVGVSHLDANKIAARIMQSLFTIDMDQNSFYQDLLKRYELSGDLFDPPRKPE